MLNPQQLKIKELTELKQWHDGLRLSEWDD